jgi:hypothetical protein
VDGRQTIRHAGRLFDAVAESAAAVLLRVQMQLSHLDSCSTFTLPSACAKGQELAGVKHPVETPVGDHCLHVGGKVAPVWALLTCAH